MKRRPVVTTVDKTQKAPLVLRDIPDVEGLVIAVLRKLSVPIDGESSERLVAAGVAAVFRVNRAVPRSEPLLPVLDGLLEQRLLELWHENEREYSVPQLKAA